MYIYIFFIIGTYFLKRFLNVFTMTLYITPMYYIIFLLFINLFTQSIKRNYKRK